MRREAVTKEDAEDQLDLVSQKTFQLSNFSLANKGNNLSYTQTIKNGANSIRLAFLCRQLLWVCGEM